MSRSHPISFGPLESANADRLIQAALAEDLGSVGDLTSHALVPSNQQGAAQLVARASGVIAGLDTARLVFEQVDSSIAWRGERADGDRVECGDTLAHVSGSLRSLLAAERVALNFVQRLSGIASVTARYVDAIQGLPCAIYDTRKTTPGWRRLEKYAVRCGGGTNHRTGLFDAVLIKDNHIVAWRQNAHDPSLAAAVRAARESVPPGTIVEIEVDDLDQFQEVLPGKPDVILLDNMSVATLRRAVELRDQHAPPLALEASGGITLHTVRPVAETGVDRISVGALTHSAPALDIALDFEELA